MVCYGISEVVNSCDCVMQLSLNVLACDGL